MGQVMLDLMDLGAESYTRESRCQFLLNRVTLMLIAEAIEDEGQVWTMESRMSQLAPEICTDVLIDCNGIDITDGNASSSQTVFDGLSRKSRPMFDAAEAFLFGGSDKMTVREKTGGRIAMVGIYPQNEAQAALLLFTALLP